MDIYLLRLADRNTGEGQQVIVQDRNPDLAWQDWVDSATFDPPLTIANPRVMHVSKLPIKRPHKTVLPTAEKVGA